MLKVFVAAFLLGLLFNIAPGAVFTETIRRGLRGRFRAAFAVQIGSLAGDAVWAVLGLMGVGVLFRVEALRLPLGVAGAAYLAWLARDAWLAADRVIDIAGDNVTVEIGALRSGVLLSVMNPQNVAYWAAIGSALGGLGIHNPTTVDYAIYFAGFMTASVVWAFACAALVHHLFGRAHGPWVRLTYRACAFAFAALAASTLRDSWIQRPRSIGPAVHAPRQP